MQKYKNFTKFIYYIFPKSDVVTDMKKEGEVTVFSFFLATLIMPKEPLFGRFRLQNRHNLQNRNNLQNRHNLFRGFVFPDSFSFRVGGLLLLYIR